MADVWWDYGDDAGIIIEMGKFSLSVCAGAMKEE